MRAPMINHLEVVAVVLALTTLVIGAVLWIRQRRDGRGRPMMTGAMLVPVAVLSGVVPYLLGVSDGWQITGAIVSMVVSAAAMIVLVRSMRSPS